MNLAPLAIQKFFDNNGNPMNGGLLFTYVAGTTTKIATYTDSTGGASNTNPIILDFRGEARVWLDPTLVYKFTLAPPGDTDPPTKPIWTVDNITSAISFADLTQQIIGQILYPRTAAEIAAGVTPTFYYYEPGNVLRYGAVGDNATDDTVAIQAAMSQTVYDGGSPIYLPQPSIAYLVTSGISPPVSGRPVTINGDGWGWTFSGLPNLFGGGTWINFVSPTSNDRVFNFPAKIEGFEASGFGIRLSSDSLNQRAMYFAEVLQANIDGIRFEGNSTALDTNTALEFADATAIGGVYSGNVNITRCDTTGIQRAIRLAANCTTFRINNNEFHGNNPSSGSTIGISLAANAVGVNIINNMFQGWATTGIDDDGTSTNNAHNYFENNGVNADHSGATFPQIICPKQVSGGAMVLPSDRTKATIQIQPRTFLVDDSRAQFGLGYRERYRTFDMGGYPQWTPTFPVVAPMTYTSVTTSTVQGSTTDLRYNVYGLEVCLDFMFQGTVGGTPGTELRVSLPTPFNTPSGRVRVPCTVFNAGAFAAGYAEIRNAETFMRVSLNTGGSFTAGAAGGDGRITYRTNN